MARDGLKLRQVSSGAEVGPRSARRRRLLPTFFIVLGSLLPPASAALSEETAVLAAGLSFSASVRYTTSQDRGGSWSAVRSLSVAASGATGAKNIALCPGIQLPTSNETDSGEQPSSSDLVLALVSGGALYRQPLLFRPSDGSLEPTSNGAGLIFASFTVTSAVCGRAARNGEVWILGSNQLGRAASPAAATASPAQALGSCSDVVAASPSQLSLVSDSKLLLVLPFVGEGSNASRGVYLASISRENTSVEGEAQETWSISGCTLQTSVTGSGLAGFGGSFALPLGAQLYRGSLGTGSKESASGSEGRRRLRRLSAPAGLARGVWISAGDGALPAPGGAAARALGKQRHRRRRLATGDDVPSGLTPLLDSAWASSISYLLDAAAASDATGVFFRSAVVSSETGNEGRRRRLQPQPSRDNQVWLTDPISFEGQVPRLLPGVGPALFNTSSGSVGGTACWYTNRLGEEPFVIGEALVATGAGVASAAVAGSSAGAAGQAAAGQVQGQSSSALSSTGAGASAASGSAASAAWILIGHTQRASLIGRSVPAFSRDLAELGRAMGWLSFHWSFTGVPSGYEDPFPVQFRGTQLKPLYIQDPAETLPSVLLAVTVLLACAVPVVALVRPCLVFAQQRGSARARRWLEAGDHPLRWAPTALASRALLLAARPLIVATTQHVASPASTGLGNQGGFLALAWMVLLLVVLPSGVLLPLLFLYWQRLVEGGASAKEADQTSARKGEGAQAELLGPEGHCSSSSNDGGQGNQHRDTAHATADGGGDAGSGAPDDRAKTSSAGERSGGGEGGQSGTEDGEDGEATAGQAAAASAGE